MIDFLKNLTKSREEKQNEQLHAYVDGELTEREKNVFESQLEQDSTLQTEVEQLKAHKQVLRSLPQYRVPRNFTLDPAQYGAPQKEPWLQFYPAIRVATVLTAFFLILTIGLDLFTASSAEQLSMADSAMVEEENSNQTAIQTAGEEAPPEAPMAEMMVEEGEIVEPDMDSEEFMTMDEADMDSEESMTMDEADEEMSDEFMIAEEPMMDEPTENTAEESIMSDMADDMDVEEEMDADSASVMAEPMPTPTTIPSPRLADETEETNNVRVMPTQVATDTSDATSGQLDSPTTNTVSEQDIVSEDDKTPSQGLSTLRWTQLVFALLFILFLAMQVILSRRIQ